MPSLHGLRTHPAIAVLSFVALALLNVPLVYGQSSGVGQEVARIRAATAQFVSVDSAAAAGYSRDVPQCISNSAQGGMGYHHLNRGYVDAKVEVERPEILLFERREDGSYVLNGVEYIIPFTRWPRDSVPPTLFGLELKREENLKLWYLHVWAWTENAKGMFADWNPAVRCPQG